MILATESQPDIRIARSSRMTPGGDVPAQRRSPHSTGDHPDAAERVRDALRNLPSPQREVIVQLRYRGKSLPETADLLGVPVETVKARLYYGLRALRRALEEPNPTPRTWATSDRGVERAARTRRANRAGRRAR